MTALLRPDAKTTSWAKRTYFAYLRETARPDFGPLGIDTQSGEVLYLHCVGYDWLHGAMTPAEMKEPFAVPRLVSEIQGKLEFADTDVFMEFRDWSPLDHSPRMAEGEFAIRETARSFEIDLDGNRITYQFADEQEHLPVWSIQPVDIHRLPCDKRLRQNLKCFVCRVVEAQVPRGKIILRLAIQNRQIG